MIFGVHPTPDTLHIEDLVGGIGEKTAFAMDLLTGYGSDSGSDAEESEVNKVHLKLSAPNTNSSSESEEEGEEEEVLPTPAAPKQKKPSLLPSADDLFASTSGPSFLAAKKTEFEIAPVKKRKAEDFPVGPDSTIPVAVARPAAVAPKAVGDSCFSCCTSLLETQLFSSRRRRRIL